MTPEEALAWNNKTPEEKSAWGRANGFANERFPTAYDTPAEKAAKLAAMTPAEQEQYKQGNLTGADRSAQIESANRQLGSAEEDGGGSGVRDMFGKGTATATTVDSTLLNPENNYRKYENSKVNSYGFYDNNYGLGGTTSTKAAYDWAGLAGDRAYQADKDAAFQRGQLGGAAAQIKSSGAQALGEQAKYAGLQGDMAGQIAGVKAGPVLGAQTLQGQSDYQGYLQQLAQGRSSANAMQSQADLFAQQYQRPDTTAAMMQHRQATDAALQSNLALARSSPGAGNMARAMVANAGATQSAAAQSAQLQAQQEAALRQSWMGAQGAAAGQYGQLSQLQADIAAKGAATYQNAQQVNEIAAQNTRQGYNAAATVYGQAGQSWGAQGSATRDRDQAYFNALQTNYGNTVNERTQALGQANYEVAQRQALEAQRYNEWLRQENLKNSWADTRTAFQANAFNANTASAERAKMYNLGSDTTARGNALQAGATALTVLAPMAGAAMKPATSAASNANQNQGNNNPDTGYGWNG